MAQIRPITGYNGSRRSSFCNKKYKDFTIPAKQLKNSNKVEFSFDKMVEELKSYDEKYVPSFAVQVDLNIPKLDLPKLQKIDG